MAGIRVLLVEDHDDTRDLLRLGFTHLGATVHVASTADEALQMMDVDVVVTDLALPGRDGFWLLEQIRALTREVPVVSFSGYAAAQVQALVDAPFDLKLLKPLDVFEVGRQLADLVATRRKRAA